jgi:hypothetical protein
LSQPSDDLDATTRLPRASWVAWRDTVGAAGIGFLWLLAGGAVLLIAAKLDYPGLGAHSDPVTVLTGIVVVGLATLRIPIGIARLSVAVLPLGALAVFGWGLSSAARQMVVKLASSTLRERAIAGARVGVPFAFICWAAAPTFRFRSGPNPVGANAGAALLFGALWGCLFGALGGLRSRGSVSALAVVTMAKFRSRASWLIDGILAGAWMLGVAIVLAGGALMLWVIIGLARGAPHGFGIGDAVAAVIYLIAFFPNVVVAVLAIAMGASVTAGAQVTFGGKVLGMLHSYSYFGWGNRSTPWFVFSLILIPIASSAAGGALARMYGVTRERSLNALPVAAATFAAPLAIVAILGSARLGAGLVRARGVGALSATSWQVLLCAAGWALVGGTTGWLVADRLRVTRSGAP